MSEVPLYNMYIVDCIPGTQQGDGAPRPLPFFFFITLKPRVE